MYALMQKLYLHLNFYFLIYFISECLFAVFSKYYDLLIEFSTYGRHRSEAEIFYPFSTSARMHANLLVVFFS